MKRIVFLLGLMLVVLGLMYGSASGSGAPGSVVGSGDFLPSDGVPRHFTINAISGPNGVSGQITVRVETTPAGTIIADVTCLHVEGNRAVVGSVITFSSTNPAAVGARVMHAFVDNGVPGGPTPDQRSAPQFPGGGPPTQADCVNAFPTAFTILFPIDPGNVTANAGAT